MRLYEQLVMPLLRRNPQARAEATRQLDELNSLGAKLRNALPDGAPAVPALSAGGPLRRLWWQAARYARGVVPLEPLIVRVEVPANTPMILLARPSGGAA